jgi:DNA-binding transcriptional LysR family regulator
MNVDLSWDEFRLVKAIADSRSLGGAAELLGLNHSTVFRRLAALERAVGAHLFERSRAGYEPTAAGDEMIALATRMADSIIEFERRVAGRDFKAVGQLRVTAPEAIGQHFMPAIMAQFQARNPGMMIELVLSDQVLNLSKREAEVAFRLTNDPTDTLVGRRICTVRWAVYGAPELVASLGSRPAESLPFIGYGEGYGPASVRRWIETQISPGRLAAKVNSVHNMLELAVHGIGVALLPCHLADPSPGLVRLGARQPDLDAGLWLLTHSDLRRSGRVRAFMDFAASEIAKQRRVMEGPDGEEAAKP